MGCLEEPEPFYLQPAPHITDKQWTADSVWYTGTEGVIYPGEYGTGEFSLYFKKESDTIIYDNGYPNLFFYILSYWDYLEPDTIFVSSIPFDSPDDAQVVLIYEDLTHTNVKVTYISYGEHDTFYMSSF